MGVGHSAKCTECSSTTPPHRQKLQLGWNWIGGDAGGGAALLQRMLENVASGGRLSDVGRPKGVRTEASGGRGWSLL